METERRDLKKSAHRNLKMYSLLVSFGLIANCATASHQVSAPVSEKPSKVVESPTPTPALQISVLSSDEIAELKEYAENYQPRSGREVIPSPPVPPDRILEIIAKAAAANSREHEKFVLLIFVRVARFQTENFRQTYELGRTNSLTKEFYRLIGRDDFESQERNGAYLAWIHVEKNSELQQYDLIDAEMRRIAKMSERIERELDALKQHHE